MTLVKVPWLRLGWLLVSVRAATFTNSEAGESGTGALA